MKMPLASLAFAAAWLLAAPGADAQVFVGPGGPTSLNPGMYAAPAAGYEAPAVGSAYGGAYVPPYSYPAAYPLPARYYVPLGPGDDFAFSGRPYGHPFDKWTWAYIGDWPNSAPARYFYPPLR